MTVDNCDVAAAYARFVSVRKIITTRDRWSSLCVCFHIWCIRARADGLQIRASLCAVLLGPAAAAAAGWPGKLWQRSRPLLRPQSVGCGARRAPFRLETRRLRCSVIDPGRSPASGQHIAVGIGRSQLAIASASYNTATTGQRVRGLCVWIPRVLTVLRYSALWMFTYDVIVPHWPGPYSWYPVHPVQSLLI